MEQQINELIAAYDAAQVDAIADYGEETIDGGGWVELARATVMNARFLCLAYVTGARGLLLRPPRASR